MIEVTDLTEEELDLVWDQAKQDVYQKFADAGHMIIYPTNPYDQSKTEHWEYEAAFEHYLMTLLGY